MPALSPEDAKLVTLARAARARTGAAQGAAVRDLDGRTYAAGTVDAAPLQLSALEVCIAMAVSSGSSGLAAAVVLGDGEDVAVADHAVLDSFAPEATLYRGDAAGRDVRTVERALDA